MTTTAGHSFYIGPIGAFYNQVNDTGSWEPLVLCLSLCYLFYQSLVQCCFWLLMWMCVYLCMSVTVFISMHGVFCVSLLFVFNNISWFKSSTELMFACLFVYVSSDFK
jgi:hypothetical protein